MCVFVCGGGRGQNDPKFWMVWCGLFTLFALFHYFPGGSVVGWVGGSGDCENKTKLSPNCQVGAWLSLAKSTFLEH